MSSCTVVRKYQGNKPFVFENEIRVEGQISAGEKSGLKAKLEGQIEDSVKPAFKNILFLFKSLNKPAVFDSNYVKQTLQNMNNLLHNTGYYRSNVIADWSHVDTVFKKNKPDQYQLKVIYTVYPGKVFKVDSISYSFKDTTLQQLALQSLNKSLLKKSEPFNRQKIDEELNRLIDIFRDNGYYKINREMIKAELDTVDVSLIDPLADPFEQIRLQLEAKARNENPTIDISILQVPVRDTSIVLPYVIGRVNVFPDEPADLQTGRRENMQRIEYKGYTFFSRYNLFKPSFLAKRISLKPGAMYRLSDYNRTLLNFNRIEAWQNVNINSRPQDSAAAVDFFIRMVPAKKFFFSVDFEGSSILSAQNQIFYAGNKGLALNFHLKNRNVARQALQLENTLRTGIEFTDFRKILSSEIGLVNRLVFPRLLTPFFKVKNEQDFLNARTYVGLDGAYIDRYLYYKINTLNAYLGYEFQKKASVTWQLKFPNIEFTRIYDRDTGFTRLTDDYPLLRYSYNDGLIIGVNATYTRRFNWANPRAFSLVRVYGEESGLLMGALFKAQTDTGKALERLYRFVKVSADFRHYLANPKTMWAFRFFAGYGIGFDTESRKDDVSLPFFRQFFAGGPNSMRGWQLRKLGPGSSVFYDTVRFRTYTTDPPGVIEKRFDDRYADIQLEANVEYRFDIFPVYGYWLKGALFTDIGNVWIRRSDDPVFKYGVFDVSRIYRDIAVAGGTGLRLDFKFFLLRFDLGWRLKDPLYASDGYLYSEKDGWFVTRNMRRPTFQFGIGYPF
ncbi:MAG: BamA/TamA family outer membrane protein [Chitinophagaceae bacterium]|nr:BamA/TamA family outer membrane protein [Chitinophagaceae bacterium]